MRKLDKATRILAKLMEVAHWIGAVGMLVGLVLTLTVGESLVIFGPESYGEPVAVYGFEITTVTASGELEMGALRIFLAAGVILMGLMAMVFRNVYLILKHSENATPFQPDNVRMVREIGVFLIAVPLVSLVMSQVSRLIVGVDTVEMSVNMSQIIVGLVVLCLSRIFARGMELENDVDGLV